MEYIICHGSFAAPNAHWFNWLKLRILDNGKMAVVPEFPIGLEKQTYQSWKEELDNYDINENTVLIGHSISSVFLCKYLMEKKKSVKKLICIAGFNNYIGELEQINYVNKTFFTEKLADVKQYCKEIICIYSKNDQYINEEVLEDFANQVATKKCIIANGGHFNTESGYDKFEQLLEYL